MRTLSALLLTLTLTACAGGESAGTDGPQVKLVSEDETGLGNEVVVSVSENEGLEGVFEDALEEYDAATVTVICAGEDVAADGYLLYGTEADGVVSNDTERTC
jgi:hypothetical protein